MRDLDQLRDLTGRVLQPGFDTLVETARRRDRRRALTTVAAGATMVVLAIGGGLLVTSTGDRTAPPVQEPTITPTPTQTPQQTPTISPKRTSMSPKEVVTDPSAQLQMTAAAFGDPDVRFALWAAACEECPRRFEQSRPTIFRGVALTTDGYRTTTYHRAGFPLRNNLPVRVTSPTDDAFLFTDSSNSGSWLLRMDGSFTSVRRTQTPIETSDPRRTFECYSRRSPTVYTTNWCVLDPVTATSYEMPLSWQNSVVGPGMSEDPWGMVHDGRSVPETAWWDVGGSRRTEYVGPDRKGTDGKLAARVGVVRPGVDGGPMYWRYKRGSATLDLLDARNRSAPWEVIARDAPPMSGTIELARTLDGGLLAWTRWPRVSIWRADDITGGDFEKVHTPEPRSPQSSGDDTLSMWGEVIRMDASAETVLESTDDGRTWSDISTWR